MNLRKYRQVIAPSPALNKGFASIRWDWLEPGLEALLSSFKEQRYLSRQFTSEFQQLVDLMTMLAVLQYEQLSGQRNLKESKHILSLKTDKPWHSFVQHFLFSQAVTGGQDWLDSTLDEATGDFLRELLENHPALALAVVGERPVSFWRNFHPGFSRLLDAWGLSLLGELESKGPLALWRLFLGPDPLGQIEAEAKERQRLKKSRKKSSSFFQEQAFEFNGFVVRELLSEEELQEEGHVMHHCVGGYSSRVVNLKSLVFSLTRKEVDPEKNRMVNRSTLEIGIGDKTTGPVIRQHYTFSNKKPHRDLLRLAEVVKDLVIAQERGEFEKVLALHEALDADSIRVRSVYLRENSGFIFDDCVFNEVIERKAMASKGRPAA